MVFISMNAFAQITVTDADIAGVGDIIYNASDSMPGTSITVGNAGANQVWDFSTLQTNDWDTTEFISTAGTPYANLLPNANMCVNEDGQFTYFKKDATGIYLLSMDDTILPQPLMILPLPLTYGSNVVSDSITMMDSTLSGPVLDFFLPDSIAPFLTQFQAHTVDSFNIKVNFRTEFDVDAYGTITTPLGTFDCLRIKQAFISQNDMTAYCTDTITGLGSGWYFVDSEVDGDLAYQWWTNDASVKFALAQLFVDSADNVLDAEFLITPQTSNVAELTENEISIFPIPATYQLNIEAEAENATYKLYDISGKLHIQNAFSNTTTIDLSKIIKGTYLLYITTEKGSITKKVIVE